MAQGLLRGGRKQSLVLNGQVLHGKIITDVSERSKKGYHFFIFPNTTGALHYVAKKRKSLHRTHLAS